MSAVENEPLVINGWRVYAHSLFLGQYEALVEEVEAARARDPETYARKNAAKRLAAITRLAFEIIPQDPTRPECRQGNTLGPQRKHWFRAKFFQQYRLFFRFSTKDKTVILVWVNDEDTKRAYGSRSDAYMVFRKMLDAGNPPSNWDELLADAELNSGRLRRTVPGTEDRGI